MPQIPHIFIAEDHQKYFQIYKMTLEDAFECEITFAPSGTEAIQILNQSHFDLGFSGASRRHRPVLGGQLARNECLQTLRRQKARPTIQPEDGLEEILVDEYDGMASIRFEHSLNLVRKLVESHKVEPRASVARMFYLQEKPVKDIAETLNLKQNTVLCHLRRFRLSISKALCDMVESGEIELQSRG